MSHDFFILSKGLNSGKPLESPCPNCFQVMCPDASTRETLFTISYALWQSKKCHQFLVGSVIPFIRKHDLEWVIDEQLCRHAPDMKKLQQATGAMAICQQRSRQIKQHLQQLEQLKRALLRKLVE